MRCESVRAPRRGAGSLSAGLAALALMTGAGALPAAARTASAGPAPRSWTVYHGSGAGRGVAAGVRSVSTAARAWTSQSLDGQIFGQPLALGRRVFAATENNSVYALSAATGSVLWHAHLGSPVPAEALPCGNITPTVGITGTPVIDRSRSEIFVVADEMVHGSPAHVLVGLSTATGERELTEQVDPPGQDHTTILQRTALALDAGRVVFGFGGNFGDCGAYRGRVAAVPEGGGKPVFFTVDAAPGESRGAVWMGGAAPVIGRGGSVWVETGNGSVTSSGHPYDRSDGLLVLSRALRLLRFFAPASWPSDNAHDIDLSSAPALLADGQVVLAGKAGHVYLVDGAHPGGIGGQQARLASACPGDIDGGVAVRGMTVYLPCASGIVAVRAARSPPALRVLWNARAGGGPPILAGGLVWTIGQDGTLYGLSPATGVIARRAVIGPPANHFPTPGIGAGLLLAASAASVVAFRTSAAAAPGASRGGPAGPPGRRGAAPGSGLTSSELAAIAAGSLAMLAAVCWLGWRLRKSGRSR